MYKAIIFDLGNVLIEVSSQRTYEYWGNIGNREPAELAKRFPVAHTLNAFERGEIEPAVFREYVMSKMGFQITETEFDVGWNRMLIDPLPDMDKIMTRLRENYRLVGLSNTNMIHADFWKVRYAAYLADLEKIFSSYEIGVLKPDPKAYEVVLAYLGMAPEEAVFVDDLPVNVAGATQLGLTGIIMKSPGQLVLELQSLGIKIGQFGQDF